jgi:polar amino acid transport system substrate-binding protein
MTSSPFNCRFVLCLAVLLVCLSPKHGVAADFFTLNTADQPPYSTQDNTGVYDQIVLEALRTLAITPKINHLPSARSLENVNAGVDDGEYARIAGLTSANPNLLMVNEKLLDFAFTAFVRDPSMEIRDWKALSSYHVAFINGWKIYETEVKTAASILKVSSDKELFNLLASGRIDVALYERRRGLHYLRSNKLEGISPLDPPLAVKGMHLYLHMRHESMIPEVEQALRSFKQTTAYRQLLDEF